MRPNWGNVVAQAVSLCITLRTRNGLFISSFSQANSLRHIRRTVLLALVAAVGVVSCIRAVPRPTAAPRAARYRSPFALAYSPDGKTLAVSDRTAGCVEIVAADDGKVRQTVALNGEPAGLAWAGDGSTVFVAEYGAGTVAQVDAAAGRVVRRLTVGPYPTGLAVAAKRQLLLAADSGIHRLVVLDLATGNERARPALPREPFAVAVTPDESLAVVSNLLPAGRATDPEISAAVSLVRLEEPFAVRNVRLPAGSTLVRGVAVSPDGRWAYVVHTVGRFALPTTQLERGWINTNALSIIDLEKKEYYATVLLDHPMDGGADPWGVVVSDDGKTLWTTLAGAQQIAKIRLDRLHPLLAGEDDLRGLPLSTSGLPNIWQEIKKDPEKRRQLINDLAALYAANLIERIPIAGKGPRDVKLAPGGKTLAVAAYYSGEILLADPATCKVAATVSLGPQSEPDLARRGEMIFHDAAYCFQHWLTCATCHPEGRADGLNWDLLNDGIGNPKNTKSLLLSYGTPPAMALGVRANMEVATVAGFRFILFHEPQAEETMAVQAYLRSLRPERSPYLLPNGRLSDKAKRGKTLFESSKTNCLACHSSPMFTNLQPYDVGTARETDLDVGKRFDTPTLTELWRTAPYLHTGEAATLHEAFTKFNAGDRHGATSHLSPDKLDALVEYLLSL